MEDIGSLTEGPSRGKRARKDSVGSDSRTSSTKINSTSKWTVKYITDDFPVDIKRFDSLYPTDLHNRCIVNKELGRYKDYIDKRTARMTKDELMQKFYINKTQYEELTKNKKIKPDYNGIDATVAEAILSYYVVLVDCEQLIYDNGELILENFRTTFSDEEVFGVDSEFLHSAKENFIKFISREKDKNNKIKYILSLTLIEFYKKLEESYIRSKSELAKGQQKKEKEKEKEEDEHKLLCFHGLDDIETEYTRISGSKKSILTLLNSRAISENEILQLMSESDRNDSYQCILPTLRAMIGDENNEKFIDDYVKSILGILSFNKSHKIKIGSLNFNIRSSSISIASGVDVMLYDKDSYKGNLVIEDKTQNPTNGTNAKAQIIGEMFAYFLDLFSSEDGVDIEKCNEKTVYGILFIGLRPTIYKGHFTREVANQILQNQKNIKEMKTPPVKFLNLISKFVLFKGNPNLITSPGAQKPNVYTTSTYLFLMHLGYTSHSLSNKAGYKRLRSNRYTSKLFQG
ncbi:hypothetical protein AX774_g2389, partial [Zancudomyces culisetae]